jgi:NAD(P)-dependent dehydrogenase (short-subunit alcohol dehydrogenase family)
MAITGAGSGVGAALAARLAKAGHEVIGVDLRGSSITADLSTPSGRADAVAGILDGCGGRLDGLVTCAGLAGLPGRPASALVSVNYFGSVALLEGLRPALAAAGGAAVAISSNSTTCQPGIPMELVEALAVDEAAALQAAEVVESMAAYPATKIGVARWVRSHAVSAEWIGAGVRLNAVAPGMIDTAMIAEGRADPTVGPLLDLFPIPMGRPGQPDEIAAVIEFLLSPAAALLCGSIVFADGGTDALLRGPDWPAPWNLDPSLFGK